MALLEMTFSTGAKDRFDCVKCPANIMQGRRCGEDRWDFTGNDHVSFPIIIDEGGTHFGFCPGKANWYPRVVSNFRTLVVCTELGVLPYEGGAVEQPADFMNLLSWFAPLYKTMVTGRRHGLTGGKKELPNASNQRRPSVQGRSGRQRGR